MNKSGSKNKKKRHVVFFDFDNTVTTKDVFDNMLIRFAEDAKWLDLEKRWDRGEIGSRECLKGQIKCIRATKKALDKYLAGIKVDPYFKRLLRFFKSRKIKTVILSDNFDYVIRRILKNNGIESPDLYCNKLRIVRDRLIPSFPYTNRDCVKCAHCKKKNLLSNVTDGSISVYIGDGLSDVCASEYADIVFAKAFLKRYFNKGRLAHVSFKGLKDVYKYLKRRLS